MKLKKISTSLLQGFFVLLPIIVTFYIGNIIFQLIKDLTDLIIPLLPEIVKSNTFLIFSIHLGIILLCLILLVLIGILVKTIIGKTIMNTIRAVFSRIPGLGSVYRATEQVTSVISNDKNNFFNRPVLVEYPSTGIWAIGFNTGEIDLNNTLDNNLRYTIFIPTTPNPTSGFLAVMTKDKIKDFNVSAEDAIKLILTGGIIKK